MSSTLSCSAAPPFAYNEKNWCPKNVNKLPSIIRFHENYGLVLVLLLVDWHGQVKSFAFIAQKQRSDH
jgi:hypothetical protein